MKTRVELDPQVAEFARSLAPEPRRRLRAALRGLEEEQGDLKPLEADLAGYARLRVARCVFVERRAVVYELFSEILRGSG